MVGLRGVEIVLPQSMVWMARIEVLLSRTTGTLSGKHTARTPKRARHATQ
jgi:hypothetical protein